MSLILRARIIAGGATVLGVWLAWQLATGEYALPLGLGAVAICGIVITIFQVPIDAAILGALLFGYLVGNRGFAQLMPMPTLPLLPAEIGLGLAGAWCVWESARNRELPFRRNALNVCVLLWLVIGTIRVGFDVRKFGILALRDYALVYYAAFFFIAQQCTAESSRRFLLRALVAASILQPLIAALVEAFPDFFLGSLTFRGMPLIYFKGDLALTFTAVSALLLYFFIDGRHRTWAWPLATFELLYVITGANRASMLGALVALGWLALSPARRFVGLQVAAVASAFLAIWVLTSLTENEWAERKFEGALERMRSVTDVSGRGIYTTEESGMKGDNNRFRAVWWRTVVEDTFDQNPVFGLGFGYDLTRNFLQQYNLEMSEDMTGRSPHSVVVSTIGRMGFLGLAVLLALVVALVAKSRAVFRNTRIDRISLGLWSSVWVIFVSACLGVVLEGPMGAVVFWSLLGMASAHVELVRDDASAEAVGEHDAGSAATIPPAVTSA